MFSFLIGNIELPFKPMESLKISQTKSFVDSSFFTKLSDLKLNKLKLNKEKIPLFGYYNFKSLNTNQECSIILNGDSFTNDESNYVKTLPAYSNFIARGDLLNFNTIDEFKEFNKQNYLHDLGNEMIAKIKDKSFINDLQILNKFNIISFADLKKFKFYYWVCLPNIYSNWLIEDKKELNLQVLDRLNSINEQLHIIDELTDELISFKKLFEFSTDSNLNLLFIDTCTINDSYSYILRNLLTALAIHNYKKVSISIYRLNKNAKSVKLTLKLDPNFDIDSSIKFVGWERTGSGKLGPKLADLGSIIDPVQLANQSIDLNLKLIKWRILPNLDLDKIQSTKILLLGSGTLGTYISRGLLGWGIRKITFVDNGNVSFSNPVRQSLYNFEDCLDGGKPKSEAAAESLKKIFPLVDSKGYQLEIPMIGHPITNESKQRQDYEKLVELIKDHDVIFLLVDSRESRWLPTVIANSMRKLVVNVALGFESYLIMRHGVFNKEINFEKEEEEEEEEERLGCYFCNDVVAPSDSMKDRTLDQMCTVTRPGVAIMASAIAIELLVSILQSENGKYSSINDSSILGSLPHQIRGFLHNFENVKLSAKNYKYCSACSSKVIKEFLTRKWDFVKDSLNNYQYIEDLTGLTQVQKEAEEALAKLDIIDSDDEGM